MTMTRFLGGVVGAIASLAAVTAAAGETKTYRGIGTYLATRALMPLTNGGAAVSITNTSIATFDPSESGFIYADCAGLGYVSSDGKITTNLLCAFRENETDGFDLMGKSDGDSVVVDVIGGSGKWEGVTGSGTFKRKFEDGPRGSYEYELTMTTP